MTKRKAIIIIVLVLLLGTAALYFILGGKTPSGVPFIPGSPFGTPPEGGPTTPTGPGGELPGGVGSDGKPLPSLVKLSDVPVAGAVGFIKNGSAYVRYVERATGHIYDVNPLTLKKTRIINTTSPKVYEALFRPDASGYVSRSLAQDGETVVNTAVTLIAPQSTSTDASYGLTTSPLRGDMSNLAATPNGSLLYALDDSGAVALSAFDGSGERTLFSMPYSEWRIHPVSNVMALLVTKASESAQGYAYRLDIPNGRLTKVLGPLMGLTALPSSDGSRVAFAHTAGGGADLAVLNSANGIELDILPDTLPEKCVWSRRTSSILICGVPEEGLGIGALDSWYEGSVSYSDRVWRFNTMTDTAEILLEPEEGYNVSIDVENPSLTPDEDYLIFMNKKDLSLWALKLEL